MRTALKIVTEPTEEPVTLAEFKAAIRKTTTDEDGYLGPLLKAARRAAERWMANAIINTVYDYAQDRFPTSEDADPDLIEIPIGPFVSLASVKWYDTADVEGALVEGTDFWVDTLGLLPRLVLKDGINWPSNPRKRNAVIVRLTVGFGAAATAVPDDIKLGIQRIGANAYEFRTDLTEVAEGAHVPLDAQVLLAPYRLFWGI